MLRDMSQYGQLGQTRRQNPEGFDAWVAQRNAAQQPSVVPPAAAPTAFQQSLQQPFVPEQPPPMLPMQTGMQGQMPATKGAGKGPMSQQMPAQALPGMPAAGKPTDINAMIQQLMSSGLLGGL